jgi:hypothetical protein
VWIVPSSVRMHHGLALELPRADRHVCVCVCERERESRGAAEVREGVPHVLTPSPTSAAPTGLVMEPHTLLGFVPEFPPINAITPSPTSAPPPGF